MNSVLTKSDLIHILLANKEQILSFGVVRLGIFGSFIKGSVHENSDVDFFVHFAPEAKTLKNFVGLSLFLQEKLGRKIELVTPQSLNKFIGKYILEQVEYVALAA